MNRTVLRLATIAALQNGGVAPYPTMAGKRVFDSRRDDISDMTAGSRFPVIMVRTDEDRSENTSTNRIPGQRTIELRMELSVLTAVRQDDGSLVVGWPASDAQLEAMLDLFEFQVKNSLCGESRWAFWWRNLNNGVENSESVPMWQDTADTRSRMAIRELRWTVRTKVDCMPKAIIEGGSVLSPDLPDALAKTFDYIDGNGAGDVKLYAAQLRAMLEEQEFPPTPVYPALLAVRMKIPEAKTPEGEEPITVNEAELLAGALPLD